MLCVLAKRGCFLCMPVFKESIKARNCFRVFVQCALQGVEAREGLSMITCMAWVT